MQNDFTPFDWARIFVGEAPPLYYAELGMKILIVFVVLVAVMRILGKTGRDHLSPLQQMLLIALGSAAGDVMLYHHVPFGHALLILFAVSGLAVALEFATTKSGRVRDVVDSRPVVLALDGVVLRERLHSQRINERELYAAIREHGGRSLAQVQLAVLEVTGRISVFLDEHVAVGGEDLLDYLREQARTDRGAHDDRPALAPAGS
jgi:uncharacterized membrane protein YcaP (DUF421 family)